MKVFVTALAFLLLLAPAFGQSTKFQLTQTSIVKDSAGTIYPFATWTALLNRGYSIKPIDVKDPKTEFILYRLTEKELKERLAKAPKPRESSYFKTGQDLKLFKATDLEGNKVDLRDSTGKIIVLNFWFINCGPCRREIPELNALVDSLKNTNEVQFYAVALDDEDALKKFLKQFPFNYTIIGNGRFVADNYGIRSYPTHVVLNQQGAVYFHTVGLSHNTVYWIRKSIYELLGNESL